MEFRVHRKLRERIKSESRDIAFIAAPGMGLSTLLKDIADVSKSPVAWLDIETIKHYWEIEYKQRSRNKRFVIHAAAARSLIQAQLLVTDMTNEELFQTSLHRVLEEEANFFDTQAPKLIVIDDFDHLPDDLALIVCNELKVLDDRHSPSQFRSQKSIRFVIGGAIDFLSLFGKAHSGVSPATNFYKFHPYDLLLSSDEVTSLLEGTFSELTELPSSIRQLIIEWSNGYLHYVLGFARWILNERHHFESLSIRALVTRLKYIVEEQNRIPLFSYCYSAWDSIQARQELLDLLAVAVSAGYVSDSSAKGRELTNLGLLLAKPTNPYVFYPANRLIELFCRQRLAECGKVLPIESSAVWTFSDLNIRAYSLIFEIENRLRCFVGDKLFAKHGFEWIEHGLEGIKSDDGRYVLEKTKQRQKWDRRSIYGKPGAIDPFLTFLDFPDLGLIVSHNDDVFSEELITQLPSFLGELVYHRRRIAHNRAVTLDQIESLKSRWQIIQKMMARRT